MVGVRREKMVEEGRMVGEGEKDGGRSKGEDNGSGGRRWREMGERGKEMVEEE
jgi:hypothetical protein